jgi:arylsulfatase A-like enzyme
MAAEGMRFTDFYASAVVCTPSRAGLMTGRYPVRSGMTSDKRRVLFPYSTGGLPREEVTIADVFKKAGYATGMMGKWHLGHRPEYLPTGHGFDYFFGLPYSNDMDRTEEAPRDASKSLNPKVEWFNVPLMEGTKIIERPADQHTLTRRYAEHAVQFIKQHKEQPFFLYFASTFPHIPLFASEKFAGKSLRGLFGDTVEELDWAVGQVLDCLKNEGLAENTLVFFTSDNGPWIVQGIVGGSAGLLKDGKGSTWEGGMREPTIAWWPGKIKAGQVNHELGCNLDFLPTAAALSGGEVPKDRPIDGVNLLPMLTGEGKGREVFVYFRDEDLYAVRKGPWKAHWVTQTGYGGPGPEKHDPPLLFNLEQDPGERFDQAKEHPEVVAELTKEFEKAKAEIKEGKNQLEGAEAGAPGAQPAKKGKGKRGKS